jgi:thiol-disulfide isomerase/thioredoxin
MNSKKSIIVAVVAVILLAGGAFAYVNSQDKQADKSATVTSTADNPKTAETTKEPTADHDEADHGNYVTLAEYNADPSKHADAKKVYFFHASWCSICQGIDKEINADHSSVPSGVTLIKTDFDKETDLRKKYGVTTQYTFVQVDSTGNETAQWTATSLSDVIEGIKS